MPSGKGSAKNFWKHPERQLLGTKNRVCRLECEELGLEIESWSPLRDVLRMVILIKRISLQAALCKNTTRFQFTFFLRRKLETHRVSSNRISETINSPAFGYRDGNSGPEQGEEERRGMKTESCCSAQNFNKQ